MLLGGSLLGRFKIYRVREFKIYWVRKKWEAMSYLVTRYNIFLDVTPPVSPIDPVGRWAIHFTTVK